MSKLQFLAIGSIAQCIDSLALIMLQHERTKNIVLGAVERVNEVDELKAKMQAENVALEMKEMIQERGRK